MRSQNQWSRSKGKSGATLTLVVPCYLARARDPVPGNIVLWRGFARLTDIAIGYSLRSENVGN